MKIKIDDEEHFVLYIEYQDNLPHDVTTRHYIPTATDGPYWRIYHWDFFANNGDKSDLRFYNSGSGGEAAGELPGPNYVDGYTGQVWHSKDVKLKGGKNFVILNNPIRLKNWQGTSINPFKVSEITHSYEYCERCGHDSTEFCNTHKYDHEDGSVRYKNDDSSAE